MIDAHEQVERFQEFLEASYKKNIHEIVSRGLKSLVLDFSQLTEFDHELADLLLEEPEEVIKAAELAVEQFDVKETVRVRFKNLPKSQQIMIKDIRSKHINKLLYFEAIVRQSSDIRPQVVCAKFECPACGSVITILQLETKFKEPTRCTCGRKGKFRLLSKDLVDAQRLVVEEAPEDLEGGAQPKRLSVFLKEDLVEPKMEKKTTPGSKVGVIGIVKEIPIILKSGVTSTRYDLMVEANYLEPIQEEFTEIELNQEDVDEIKNLASDPHIYERLINSIAPSIWGHEKIKEALILQLIGGVRKHKKDGTITRGDMHILLVGDPGSGKSALLQFISKAAPKARYVAGRSTSGAGICVAPNSLVMTNPGGLHEIQGIVEEKLANNEERYKEIAWRSKVSSSGVNIFTLDKRFNVHSKKVDQFWRILPPEKMCRLRVRSGKEIVVTPNTMLLTISNGEVVWRKSSEIIYGDFVATARKLPSLQKKKVLVINLIKSNPIVYGVKLKVREMIEKLTKIKTKRDLARELRLNENKLYHHWVKEKARGNIHLDDLKRLAELSKTPLEEIAPFIKMLSLYKGHRIKIPVYINKELMYFAGLIAGDGDLSEGEHTVGVRFSNSDKDLMKRFVSLSKGLFGVNCNLSSDGTKRVKSYRFSSKLVFEILNSLGIPSSPKSTTIDISNLVLNLDDELVTNYLKGYFDTDGSVVKRKNGPSYVDLSSSSKNIAKKLPLLLIRFGILSKVRKRSITINPKVTTKHENYLIEIKGKDNLVLFRDKVGFKNPRKSDKLKKIISALPKSNTNVDVVPNVSLLFKKIVAKYRGSYKDLGLTHMHLKSLCNPSKGRLREIVNKIEKAGLEGQEVDLLRDLANSDIFWDQVVVNDLINHDFEYVYDLTVSDSHNFLVDGFVVHNTASVVKDEFLKGWALEAGAMVLANKGIMCLHPDTNVILNNKITPIKSLYNTKNENLFLNTKKEEILFNEMNGKTLCFNFNEMSTTSSDVVKITRKHYKGPLKVIEFESGFSIKLTPNHKLVDGNSLEWKNSEQFKEGDYVLAPLKLPSNNTELFIFDILPDDWKVMLNKKEKEDLKKVVSSKFKSLSQFNKLFGLSRHFLSGGSQISLSKLKEVLTSFGIYDEWKYKNLCYGRKKSGQRLKIFKVTPDISYFLGFVLGDGTIRITDKNTRISIVQSVKKDAIIKKIVDCWGSFSDRPLCKSSQLSNSIIRGKKVHSSYYNFYSGSNLIGWVYEHFTKNSLSNILKLDDDCIKAFIAGLIDSDGCISTKISKKENKNYKVQHLEFFVSNKLDLNLNLIMALRRLDVYGRLGNDKSGLKYKVSVTGRDDVNELYESLKDYSVKLNRFYILPKLKNISPSSEKIPKVIADMVCDRLSNFNRSYLMKKGVWSTIHRYNHGVLQPSRKQVETLLDKSCFREEFKNEILSLIKRDYFIDKIKKVYDEDYNGYVYDLLVPNYHNFVASGIFVHNCLDEMDKMQREDTDALHEAMEQQQITISKANIQATLRAETTVLAAANPKLGRFDPYKLIAEQIDLPPALINRFDLIFPIRDLPDKARDTKIAQHVLELQQEPDSFEADIPVKTLRKFISYVKQKVFPKLTDSAFQEIKNFYVGLRNTETSTGKEGVKPIPITPRQLEALIRLAEGSARVRLDSKINRQDAKRAIDLLKYCLMQVGIDPETGQMDIDVLSTGISTSTKNKMFVVRDIIGSIEEKMGDKFVPINEVIKAAEGRGIDESTVMQIIDRLNREGEVFKPREGFVKKI